MPTITIVLLTVILTLSSTASARDQRQLLAERAKAVLTNRCFRCHGQNGVAVKNIFILDRTRLVADGIVIPGDEGSKLMQMIDSGEMPLGGPKLNDTERATLRDWIINNAPDWNSTESEKPREFLSETALIVLIEQDLLRVSDRMRPFIRYFSIAHLYNAGIPENELEEYRQGLAKLLNSLSWQREITLPRPIDSARTLLRIDLRDYNWTAATWRQILATYPYGIRFPAQENITRLSGTELPYIRADWFVANGSVPPLYHDLLALPTTVIELERMLGVDANRNIAEERNIVRAGLRNSGVSQNNRVVERHTSLYGAYWKSYDFRSNLDNQNIFTDPINLRSAGGEIIFNLPNGMQAYFLANGQGRRIDSAPIEIVSDRNNPEDPVIKNGRSCMSCHYSGIKPFKDDIRAVVEGQSFVSFDREKALALYQPQDILDRLIEQDRARFLRAVEQAGLQIVNNAQSEPINALSRKFSAEIGLNQAAAEVGMNGQEFQTRVRLSARLNGLGLSQLLIPNGAFKRDAWERHYGDLVQELRLGDYLSANRLVRDNRLVNNVAATVTPVTTTPIQPQAPGFTNRRPLPADALHDAQTIFVKSKTTFLKAAVMIDELRKLHPFQANQLFITDDPGSADLIMELDRPLFTFTFTFKVTDAKSRIVVTSGKVEAFDGLEAAPKISREFFKRLQVARQVQ